MCVGMDFRRCGKNPPTPATGKPIFHQNTTCKTQYNLHKLFYLWLLSSSYFFELVVVVVVVVVVVIVVLVVEVDPR